MNRVKEFRKELGKSQLELAKDFKTRFPTSLLSPNLSNHHHSNFIENVPRHSAFSSPQPPRLVRDYHLFNNPHLRISRVYTIFKELKEPLARRSEMKKGADL